MYQNQRELFVQILRFVDVRFPGWVETQFVDANGIRHAIIDKVPTFTTEVLDENSQYPRDGTLPCKFLTQWEDATGRQLARISTPGMESTEGLSEFVVEAAKLSESSG